MEAQERYRRTRSGGVLYRIDAEERAALGEIVCRGRVWWDERAKAYAVEFIPPRRFVDLIQGDKSHPECHAGADNSARFVGTGPPSIQPRASPGAGAVPGCTNFNQRPSS